MSNKFFDQINSKFKKDFDKLAIGAKSIIITSHYSPDDDSIASVLSTYYYLTKYLGQSSSKIRMVYTGIKTDRWNHFKNYVNVEFVTDVSEKLMGSELLIIVDAQGLSRSSQSGKAKAYSGKSVVIDHHPTPESYVELQLVAPQYSSCAEIIYRLFFEKQKNLEPGICETLLMGIMGDTGSFKYISSKQAGVFDVAKRLVMDGDINIEHLQNQYQMIEKATFRLFVELASNSKFGEIEGWPVFVYTYLDRTSPIVKKATRDEIKDASHLFTNYLKTIKGYEWGFVLTPRDNDWSFSFRSAPGSVNVRLIGEAFGGGGHNRAGGMNVGKSISYKVGLDKLFDWMKHNKPELI